MSSAKPLSFKNSSDIVLKHKITLAAVLSGVVRSEVGDTGQEGELYNSSGKK